MLEFTSIEAIRKYAEENCIDKICDDVLLKDEKGTQLVEINKPEEPAVWDWGSLFGFLPVLNSVRLVVKRVNNIAADTNDANKDHFKAASEKYKEYQKQFQKAADESSYSALLSPAAANLNAIGSLIDSSNHYVVDNAHKLLNGATEINRNILKKVKPYVKPYSRPGQENVDV